MDLVLKLTVQMSPDTIDYFCPRFVKIFAEMRDKCEPVDGALMGKCLFEDLQFKFLKENTILIKCLYVISDTFSK